MQPDEAGLRNPYHGTDEFGGRDDWSHTWFHGTTGHDDPDLSVGRPEDEHRGSGQAWPQPNKLIGTHMTPLRSVAQHFAHGVYASSIGAGSPGIPSAIVHAHLHMQNPRHFPTEKHLNLDIARYASDHHPGWHDDKLNSTLGWNYSDQEGTHRDWHAGHPWRHDASFAENRDFSRLADQAQRTLQWHPRLPEIMEGYRRHLEDQGHHGITYGNEVEGPGDSSQAVRHISAIATRTGQIETTHVEHIAPPDFGRPDDPPPAHGQISHRDSEALSEPEEMLDRISMFHSGHGGALPARIAVVAHFEGAFMHREPGLPNPHTGHDEWFHGTRAYPEELSQHGFMDPMDIDRDGYEDPDAEPSGHWNALLGNHFTADHKVAHEFATGEHDSGDNDRGDDHGRPAYQGVVHARLHLRSPKVYESEHDMDHEAYEHEFAAGNHPSNHVPQLASDDEDDRYEAEDMWSHADRLHQQYGNREIPRDAYTPHGTDGAGHPERTLWLSTHPDRHDIAQRFRDRLEAAGHDGVVYGNEYEVSGHGRQAVSAIAFHPHRVEIQQHHHAQQECLDPEEAEAHQRRLPAADQAMLPGLDHDSGYEHIAGAAALPLIRHFAAAQADEDEDDTDEPEPSECEYCGHDLDDQDGHAEEHHAWLGEQKWYTDWDEEGPGEHLHRGIAMRLPQALHDHVHDASVPQATRAHALLQHVLHEQQQGSPHGGLGNFWSSERDVSKSYAESTRVHIPYREGDDHSGYQTPVMLHVHTPSRQHFETDPDTLDYWGVHSFHNPANREVPLQNQTPLRISGISWAQPDHGEHHHSRVEHMHADPAWTHHEFSGDGIRAIASGTLASGEVEAQQAELNAIAAAEHDDGLSWDEIGERHPRLYGDPDYHGDEADGSDGPGIGDMATQLAFGRPGHADAEDHDVSEMTFHPRTVDPARIDYARSEPGDPRVRRARLGYESQDPERVPPLVLVHRHGVFQVADGHHRAEGAARARKPVRAYVAYSPHEDESFSDKTRGPFHGADTEDSPAPMDATSGQPARRITYPGFPHAAEVGAGSLHTAGRQNPPCCFCGEPLDDQDVDDEASAHDECSAMRWCHACDEEHDDPSVAEDHNSAYTDWANHLPFEGGIHRGITVRLPRDVHAIVHDESRPPEQRASALHSYLRDNPHDDSDAAAHAGGYGVHWTDHEQVARNWGSGEGAMFSPEIRRTDPEVTHVVMHAASPHEDDIETDPYRLTERNMLGYDHPRSEAEIPLRADAPVRITGLSWKRAGTPATAWQRHELPDEHAVVASLIAHASDTVPYHPEAACPHCRSRNWEPTELPSYVSDDIRRALPAPARCRNCGDDFDASRSGREVAEERDKERQDWERSTAERTYNGEPLHHGTRSILHPGDTLTAEDAGRHPSHPSDISEGYVHATPSGSEAYGWAERGNEYATHQRMQELGRGNPDQRYRPRVYEVEPMGHVESDPHGEGTSFRSPSPMRVVREVHPEVCYHPDHEGEYHWPDHPHYEALAQDHDEDDDEDDDDSNEREHEAAAVASIDAHDSDGYTVCDQGHEHWGLSGAAGLLIRHQGDDGQTRYLLQHRSPHVQHGNTWSTPGGAMGSGEVPEHAALREAREELGELPGDLTHHHTVTDDHGGGWAYHTVVMDSPHQFTPGGEGDDDWESSGHGWFTPHEIQDLPLHPGFAASWGKVQHSGALRVVALDGAPAFTHRYLSAQPDGDYAEREELIQGPFYHGGRSKRLGEGDALTPGRKTNGWGDEGPKSQFIHFTTDLGGAAEYARQAGGHVYEVEPAGDVQMGYSGSEWKSKGPLKVRRIVPPEEIARHAARAGQLIIDSNVADGVVARVAPSLPSGACATAAMAGWTPENATQVHALLDDFPGLFRALHEGLTGVVRNLEESPVSPEITDIVRRMATSCLDAAEDAAEVASRPLDGPEGMWEGSLAGKA